MADLNLLVPGTGGTTLVDNSGEDTGYPVRMRLGTASKGLLGLGAQEYLPLLSMEHRADQIAPVKTSLKPGVSLRPGHVLRVAYNQVDHGFNQFLYDWRSDIRHSARQLLDLLRERQSSDGGRWNLVGHSQGGLVIVTASRLLDDPEEFSTLVRRVALVGSPLAGTVNAAEALLLGEVAGESAAPHFQKIVRTFPALYQMLPQWPAMMDGAAPAPEDRQLLSEGGWEGIDGIRADFLGRTRAVIPYFQSPLDHMKGDIRVGIFLMRNRNTAVELLTRAGGPTGEVHRREKGDTLTPFATTIGWLGERLRPFVVPPYRKGREHAFMLSDPAVATDVKGFLQ